MRGTLHLGGGSDFFVTIYRGWGSEINSPWSRGEGSYVFKHIGGQNLVFIKKMSQLLGSLALPSPPPPHYSYVFSFYFFTLGETCCQYLQQDQHCIIFFSDCLNLSTNLFICNMLFGRNVQGAQRLHLCSNRLFFSISPNWLPLCKSCSGFCNP